MSYWACSRAAGHHGGKTSHQQCSRIYSSVSLRFLTTKKSWIFRIFPWNPLEIAFSLNTLSKLKAWWQKRKLYPANKEKGENDEDDLAPWETDYRLLVCEGLFDEYLEMGELLNFIIPTLIYLHWFVFPYTVEKIYNGNVFLKLPKCYMNTGHFYRFYTAWAIA